MLKISAAIFANCSVDPLYAKHSYILEVVVGVAIEQAKYDVFVARAQTAQYRFLYNYLKCSRHTGLCTGLLFFFCIFKLEPRMASDVLLALRHV